MSKVRKSHRARSAPGYPGSIRIIGGTWRRRRLVVPPAAELRPTPDRVRETVFNWLQPWLPGAHCIDLFAGSGALCLEALSRGAASAVMVEAAPQVVEVLRENVARLRATNASVVQADAEQFLQGAVRKFDIVFLDPPFRSKLIASCARLLDERGWLSAHGLVYIEAPSDMMALPIPASWEMIRSRTAGQVGYHLARKQA